ncbi:MAG: DMT family transporter [Xanthomonadales bacterium]|nr:DMT family transporter [Xanthomonadales bacterium]
MLLAVAAFAFMDACMKVLTDHYPPLQIAALRGLVSLPLVLLWIAWSGAFASLWKIRWGLHLFRGVMSVLMMGCFVYGLRTLPLSEAYALFFVAPLLLTALSVPILGEQVGWRRWLAIAIGILGVLYVLRPTGAGMVSLAGLAIIAASFGYALTAITVRVLGRTDSPQAIVFWMITMLSVFALAAGWRDWVPVRGEHAQWLVGVAISGALGQWAITEAFRRGEASVVAPLEYTALAWGMLLDWTLWQVMPEARVLVGALVVAACGVYLILRESQLRRAAPDAE